MPCKALQLWNAVNKTTKALQITKALQSRLRKPPAFLFLCTFFSFILGFSLAPSYPHAATFNRLRRSYKRDTYTLFELRPTLIYFMSFMCISYFSHVYVDFSYAPWSHQPATIQTPLFNKCVWVVFYYKIKK